MNYSVEIEVLDGEFITPRTGKSKIKGETSMSKPVVGEGFIVMYDKGEAKHPDNPSPGMISFPSMVEGIGKEYKYYDETGRPFKVKYLEDR